MPYFALIYEVVEEYIARRAPYREEHLRLAQEAHRRGEILLAGAFSDPADRALLIFRTPDRSAVEAFVSNDPYVRHGLVKRWEVQAMDRRDRRGTGRHSLRRSPLTGHANRLDSQSFLRYNERGGT